MPNSPTIITPTPQTIESVVDTGLIDTLRRQGDRATGDSITVGDEPAAVPSPDPLDTQANITPVSERRRITRIRVIGPRTPPGYLSSDSEGKVERLVLSE